MEREKLIGYLYDLNLHCDITIERLADNIIGFCESTYLEGKEDAIDKCLKMLDESYKFHASNASYPLYDDYCKGIEDSIMILEKLKEQKE